MEDNTGGIIALVLGILSFFFLPLALALLAIIVGLYNAHHNTGAIGAVLGIVRIVMYVIGLLILFTTI